MNEESPQGRELLAMVKPPKPIGEMTDEEQHAFARELFELINAKMFGEGDGPAVDDVTP